MSDHICPNCTKSFSTVSNLNAHMKNTSYCKKLKDDPNYILNERTCKGCDKLLNTKQNYERHISVCKEFAIHVATQTLKEEYEEKIKQLREELEKYKHPHKTKFGQLVNMLPMFTEVSVKNKIREIRHQSLLTLGENTVNTNFVLYITNSLKEFVFCTDIARGKIIVRRDINMIEKITSKCFIIECFIIAREELITLLNDAFRYCKTQVNNLTHEDYTTSMNHLISLNTYVSQSGVNTIVNMISKQLVTVCNTLSNETDEIEI